jgi:hypothetical protein
MTVAERDFFKSGSQIRGQREVVNIFASELIHTLQNNYAGFQE